MSRARLEGKTAVISGAAQGQGRSHALRLAAEGADIVAIDLEAGLGLTYPTGTREKLEETARMVEALGRRAHVGLADTRSPEALAAVVAETARDFPAIDVIVANAGVGGYGRVLEMEVEDWQQVLDINLTGTFNTIKAFAPRMVEAGNGGSIIIISSLAGIKGLPFTGAYTASKHGLQGLMRVLAQELGEHGIRVNTINPGPIATPLALEDTTGPALLTPESEEGQLFFASFQPYLPMPEGGFLEPSVVSDAVAWLASPESAFVTGIAVPVDAGVHVR